MSTYEKRVGKLEQAQGDGEEEVVFQLRGLKATLMANGTVMAVFDADLVTAPFVEAVIRQQFPDAKDFVILADNFRGVPLEQALPRLEALEYRPE